MATLSRGIVKRANTIEENRKALSELLRKNECLEPSQEELNRLFTRLNHLNARDYPKNLKSYEPAWRSKKVSDPIYGPVAGIPCGSWWGIRMDCSRDRMHDPFSESVQCGPVGAVSICTSRVNSDVDLGDILSFTGQSCREEGIGRVEDQEENRALVLNFENRVPVRIIRSYNLSNEYSPKTGYRYDGLYMVVDYWIGVSEQNDYSCYKFALRRLSHQEPPPWRNATENPVPVPRHLQNCNFQGIPGKPATRVEKDAMRLRKRESKTQKIVKSVRKLRRRPSELNAEPVSAGATTSTTTMLLHALPGRKIMSPENKNVNVSAIVTRRVSKKLQKNSLDKLLPDCAVKAWNVVGGGEHQLGNEKGEDEVAQSQSTRLQNTNISIRTDLYDSSHNLKQHVKKCGSQATHGLGIFKPRVLAVQMRENNFVGMDSGLGSSRTTSCVKMERVKAPNTQTNKRNLNNIVSQEKDKTVDQDIRPKSPASSVTTISKSAEGNQGSVVSSVQKTIVSTVENDRVKEKELLTGWEALKNRCLHSLEHSYASREVICDNSVDEEANHEAESERLESRCSKDESDTSTSSDLSLQERTDEEKTEFCEPEAAGSFRSPENEPELKNKEQKSPEKFSPYISPPFKGSGNNSWYESSIMMKSLTLEKMLDIITVEKSSPMAKMLISNVIGANPVFNVTKTRDVKVNEITSGDQATSQNPEVRVRSSRLSKTGKTSSSIRTRSWGRQAADKTTNSLSTGKFDSRELGRFENSKQQEIIEIVYSGEELNLTQDSGEETNANKSSDPVLMQCSNTRRSKAAANDAVVNEDKSEGEERAEDTTPRIRAPERKTWPSGSEDTVDFCCDQSTKDAVGDREGSEKVESYKPRLIMRGKKDTARLWKAQSISKSSASQASSEIPKARIITRSKCEPSRREVRKSDEADAVGKEKPVNKMRLEVANLFIDMNMSPSSQMSKSRSRRSLRGANHSRRRTCPAVVDRALKRRSDEPVKHPTSPLKRLKKSVVKIQSSSGKILGAVISKKGLSLRKKNKNGANHLNNNNNNNTNNNNNSVKRMGKSEKSTTTMMSKKAIKSTARQNLVEKKNTVIPKRRDTAVLTRSRGSLAVGRLRLRRTLISGTETYPRKKKKTKDKQKQKQKPTAVEKGTKRKIIQSKEQQPAKTGVVEFALKKAKLDYNICKASKSDVKKPKMVSVMTQCSLIPETPFRSESVSDCLCSSRNSGLDQIKNEMIELIEIKSEALDDDVAPCEEAEDEDTEENEVQTPSNSTSNCLNKPVSDMPKIRGSKSLKGLSQSLGSLNEPEGGDLAPKKGFIRYVAGHRPHPSAFVPVQSVEGSLRIAQLKSIGFKPIKPGVFPPDVSEIGQRNTSDSPKIAYSSAVVKRGVQEEYNKYTSEENNVVQYMDSKLCYEDIENEDLSFTKDDTFVEKVECNELEEGSNSILRDEEEEEEDEELEFSMDDVKEWETQLDPNSSNSENLEQAVVDSDGDLPWHGWRKIVSNKESYFVGW